jgi:hypothetical protein
VKRLTQLPVYHEPSAFNPLPVAANETDATPARNSTADKRRWKTSEASPDDRSPALDPPWRPEHMVRLPTSLPTIPDILRQRLDDLERLSPIADLMGESASMCAIITISRLPGNQASEYSATHCKAGNAWTRGPRSRKLRRRRGTTREWHRTGRTTWHRHRIS